MMSSCHFSEPDSHKCFNQQKFRGLVIISWNHKPQQHPPSLFSQSLSMIDFAMPRTWSHDSACKKWKSIAAAAHCLTIPLLVWEEVLCNQPEDLRPAHSVSCKTRDATKKRLSLTACHSIEIRLPPIRPRQSLVSSICVVCLCWFTGNVAHYP